MLFWEHLQVMDYKILNTKSGSKAFKPKLHQLLSGSPTGGVSVISIVFYIIARFWLSLLINFINSEQNT